MSETKADRKEKNVSSRSQKHIYYSTGVGFYRIQNILCIFFEFMLWLPILLAWNFIKCRKTAIKWSFFIKLQSL